MEARSGQNHDNKIAPQVNFNSTVTNIMDLLCIFVITKQYLFQRLSNHFQQHELFLVLILYEYFFPSYHESFSSGTSNYFCNVYRELFFHWAENYFSRYRIYIFRPTMHCTPLHYFIPIILNSKNCQQGQYLTIPFWPQK